MSRLSLDLPAVLRVLGRIHLLIALAQLAPLVCALAYSELDVAIALLASMATAASVGLVLGGARSKTAPLYRREGILIVVAGWLSVSLLGALPYLFSGGIPNLIDALFESASGFTTTGASVLVDIEAQSHAILFWRSMTQWLGGLGIIVLFVALLAGIGPGARFLFRTEAPGPSAEILHPRVHDTALALLKLYLALTGILIVLLLLSGLDVYDAITHSLSTLSTGGYSPRGDSATSFSPLVQMLLIVFMLVAGINFTLLVTSLEKPGMLLKDPELRVYLLLAALATLWISYDLGREQLGNSLDAAFQVVSIITSTGYASADFDQWPDGSRAILVALMMVGGSAGSTAGGIKVVRVLLLYKAASREVRLTFSPNAIIPVTIAGQVVPRRVIQSAAAYLVLYVLLAVAATVFLTLPGRDLTTALTATISCLGNVGPGLAGVGPANHFASFTEIEKLLLVALMWLGRLEILAIAATLSPSFWRR